MQDKKHKMIYAALVNMLGGENVSDNPSVMLAYSRDWMPESTINPKLANFVNKSASAAFPPLEPVTVACVTGVAP